MQFKLYFVIALLLPLGALAQTPGKTGFESVRHCVMENDVGYCHSIITPTSVPLFDRFVSYKLMPCLPTDFSYVNEEAANDHTTVKVTMPAGGNINYVLRLIFLNSPSGPKLDIPASLERGLGTKWQDKIQLSEQLYLIMRQNMGDKLTCDMLNGLVKPH
jgi:hypothetical protein